LDPKVTVKPLTGQIDDLINEARNAPTPKSECWWTTLTKRSAEELTDYLREMVSADAISPRRN